MTDPAPHGPILFYVQHLLGIGHLRRAARIARAIAARGLEVLVASGGMPSPGLDLGAARLIQLPPARTEGVAFGTLLDADGRPVDEAWRAARRERLLALFAQHRPAVVLLEMFPFGRRQMRFELLPLLEAASAAPWRPAVLTSVRDILVEKQRPDRVEDLLATVERHVERVLVHGDPSIVPFERTFPAATRIADRLAYTGFVVDPPAPAGDGPGRDEVLVSAGGGAVGAALLETAVRARPLSRQRDATWRVLAGHNLDEATFAALRREAGRGLVVERARDDFTAMLGRCRLSIAQAGYNTVMEALAAGARSVAVPFAAGQESEQTLRAELLAERGLLEVLREADLDPERLAAAVDRAAAMPRPSVPPTLLAGAERTAEIVAGFAAQTAAA